MAEGVVGFTIFLLKQDQVKEFEKAYQPKSASAMELVDGLEGRFHPLPSRPSTPRWVDAIRPLLKQPDDLALTSQSPAGLLVITRKARTYVITFGYAWLKLDDKWIERDFGRRVALNLIKADGLIEIRSEQVFAKWHVASDRAPRAAKVDEFGVEFDRDLVAVVEGEPATAALGRTVRGGTSLRLNVAIKDLPALLDTAEAQFQSDAYKKHWPDIDNLTPVKDSAMISRLEAQVDSEFKAGTAQKRLILFTPIYRRDDPLTVDSYVFGRMSKTPASTPYLTAEHWLSYLAAKGIEPSIAAAMQTPIHMFSEDENEGKTCTAFECFGYEVGLDSQQFILSSGAWYEVVPQFLNRINRAIADIDDGELKLDPWNQTDREGVYNKKCAKDPSLLFFDAKNIMFGGGQSKFEFCDLMQPNSKTMIFAKIASRSSGMSHLVEQVRRTSELVFAADGSFRKKLKKAFEEHHPSADRLWLDSRPVPWEWHMCLVSLGRKKTKLPFFAKCSLMQLHKDMTTRGHRVSFVDV